MLFNDAYKTIAEKSAGSFRDRGSKFISEVFPITDDQEIKKKLKDVKKRHAKASHHCYAMRLTPDKSIYKFSDDREPSGTAGKPILNVILSNDLTDVVIIVSRYFGGSLLGVPGLINAYSSAAQNAIDNAVKLIKTTNNIFELQFEYSLMNEVMRILKSENIVIKNQRLSELCLIEFEVRKSKSQELLVRISENHLLNKNCKIKSLS